MPLEYHRGEYIIPLYGTQFRARATTGHSTSEYWPMSSSRARENVWHTGQRQRVHRAPYAKGHGHYGALAATGVADKHRHKTCEAYSLPKLRYSCDLVRLLQSGFFRMLQLASERYSSAWGLHHYD